MNALLFLAPLSLFLETGLPIGLFVPGGDTLLLALGALAAEGGLEAFPLLPLLFLGSFLGHLLGYALGRYGGKALRRRFPEDLWKKGERLALRYGPLLLLLPGKPPLAPGASPSGLLPGAAPPPLGHPLRASPPRGDWASPLPAPLQRRVGPHAGSGWPYTYFSPRTTQTFST